MGTRTRVQVVTGLRWSFTVGTVVAGVVMAVVAGSVRHADAAIVVRLGDAYCHAVAAGPRYFHSGVSPAWVSRTQFWASLDDASRQSLHRRVLDDLAVEFARFVAEHHDVDSLLSLRCDLVASPDVAAEMIDTAAYFRDGAQAFFSAGEKERVEWTPNFEGALDRRAPARTRTALVIGNGAYAAASTLESSADDAAAVEAVLERIGFDVTPLLDAGKDAMDEALRAFGSTSAGAELALVFYSGHGADVDGANYLIPIDASFDATGAAPLEFVSLDEVVEATAGAQARIVILDTVFEGLPDGSQPRDTSRPAVRSGGLGMTTVSANTLIAYADVPGGHVMDGSGRTSANSAYATALLRNLQRPGLDLLTMFGDVARDVFEITSGAQAPAVYSSLTAPVTLYADASVDLLLPGECSRQLGLLSFPEYMENGTLDGSCSTEHYPAGEYAVYYGFTLDDAATVTLEMTSVDVDSWLALRSGSPPGGVEPLEEDDDGGTGFDARIERFLNAGDYTIEATTLDAGETGDFTLTVTVGSGPGLPHSPVLGRAWSASHVGENGWTDLHYAAALNRPDLVRRLLDAGAAIDARLPDHGERFSESLRQTLEAFGFPGTFDDWILAGETPLYLAAGYSNSVEVVDLLLARGANLEAVDSDGNTPLHYAAGFNDSVAVLELFLARGATLEAVNDYGNTPLHFAAANNGSVAVLELLLARGATLEATNNSGETPLELAGTDAARSALEAAADVAGGVSVADGCSRSMGLLGRGTHTRRGTLDGSCSTEHYPAGEYALYYGFTLDEAAEVTMEMASPDVDSWLALRRGAPPGGVEPLEEDDDGGTGVDARIERSLAPGSYTIEATTYSGGETGDFTLTVTVSGTGGVSYERELPVGGAFSAAIESEGDEDTYRITASSSGRLTVHTTGGTDTLGDLLDARRGTSWVPTTTGERTPTSD